MRILAAVMSSVWLLVMADAAAAQADGGQRTGTFSVSTGTPGDTAERMRAVKIESGAGPYRRAQLGTGVGLDPQPIAYLGQRLGLPVSLFPIDLVIEFCEVGSINAALLGARCPTSSWVLDQTVIFQANYEPIDSREADNSWFDPSKQYVMIWRDGERVIRYSTPIRFSPRTP